MAELAPCRSCRRPVTWTRTAATGKPMPLDESADRGNVLIDEMGRSHVFRDNEAAREALEAEPERWSVSVYISHHAEGQCPHGRAWKGAKRTSPDAPTAPTEPAQGSLL